MSLQASKTIFFSYLVRMCAAISLTLAASLCNAAATANPTVEMVTSLGTMRIELYADKAPKTVENFLQYTNDKFYDGTIFHRVIPGFMVQGGGFAPDMEQKKARDPIANEAQNGLKNAKGTLAMARTSNPHSATAQFFINVADNEFLNFSGPTQQGFGYAVFGRVTQGMEIVDKIVAVPTGNRSGHQNVPLSPVVIKSMRVVSPISQEHFMVRLHTNFGVVGIELDTEKAPETVANFLQYVDEKHFDNTIFHRVIDGFMIQGGGFEPGMKQKGTRAPVKNEADNGLKNESYTVAMARTSNPHSATAQFFINVADNDFLNFTSQTPQGWGYCVFGRVTEGQDVVDRIKKVRTGSRAGHQDVPQDDVIIERAELV